MGLMCIVVSPGEGQEPTLAHLGQGAAGRKSARGLAGRAVETRLTIVRKFKVLLTMRVQSRPPRPGTLVWGRDALDAKRAQRQRAEHSLDMATLLRCRLAGPHGYGCGTTAP